MDLLNENVLAELRAYRQSEENRKNCRPFADMCREYVLLHSRYADSFAELRTDAEARIHRRAYAKGGACLHRGFYSPSMMDAVVGGLHRGRLLQQPPKDGRYTYEYHFDAEDRLICAVKQEEDNGMPPLTDTEFLLYLPEGVLGLMFDVRGYLALLSVCQYENGAPIRYETARISEASGEVRCAELHKEIRSCKDGRLHTLDFCQFVPDLHLEQMRYTFARDAEGYLSTYTAERIYGFRTEHTPPREYRVYGKFR